MSKVELDEYVMLLVSDCEPNVFPDVVPMFTKPAFIIMHERDVPACVPVKGPERDNFDIVFPWILVAVVVPALTYMGYNLVVDTPINVYVPVPEFDAEPIVFPDIIKLFPEVLFIPIGE